MTSGLEIDDQVGRPDRSRRPRGAVKDEVGTELEQRAVLPAGWLSFGAVDDHERWTEAGASGPELLSKGELAAAAADEPGRLGETHSELSVRRRMKPSEPSAVLEQRLGTMMSWRAGKEARPG